MTKVVMSTHTLNNISYYQLSIIINNYYYIKDKIRKGREEFVKKIVNNRDKNSEILDLMNMYNEYNREYMKGNEYMRYDKLIYEYMASAAAIVGEYNLGKIVDMECFQGVYKINPMIKGRRMVKNKIDMRKDLVIKFKIRNENRNEDIYIKINFE